MNKEMYTLEEVAQMSAFSTKSLRNFMKKNLLSGEKINGKWYFTEEAFGNFLNETYVKQGLKIKSNSVIEDYLEQKKDVFSVCSVYDYPSTKEEAMKLCKEMTDRINAMQTNITFNFHYDTKKGMGRYIILGPFKQVHQITDKVF